MPIIKITNARLSFPDLFNATQVNGDGPFKYRAALLMDEGATVHVQQENKSWKPTTMKAAIASVAKAKWDDRADAAKKTFENNPQKCCWYDGDLKEYDGYPGNWVLSATRNQSDGRPNIVAADKTPLTEKDGKPYSGCYVNATVELWPQDNKHGKGVRATLRGVQFVKDGDAFSAGTALSDDEFEPVEAPDTEDELV